MERLVCTTQDIQRKEDEFEFWMDHVEEIETCRKLGNRFRVHFNQWAGRYEILYLDHEGNALRAVW